MTHAARSGAPSARPAITQRRSWSTFIGGILAVIALFGVIALSGWHNAVVHDGDAVHISSIKHDHAPSKQVDPDAPIHLIAHVIEHWVSAGPFAMPIPGPISRAGWVAFDVFTGGGIDPAALLRPPRD